MGTNYIAPIWRMPENTNKDKLSNYNIDFNPGDSNYIDCGDSDLLSFGDSVTDSPFSISAWINMDSATNFRIVSKYDAPNYEYQFDVGSSNKLQFYIFDGSNYRGVGYDTALNTGEWYHVIATYDGSGSSSGMTLYLNGLAVNDVTFSNGSYTAMHNTTATVKIGRIASSYADGKISQVCIFGYALNSTQVTYLYNLNNPMVPGAVNLTAPIAYWPLGDNGNPNSPGSFPNISVGTDSVFAFVTADALRITDSAIVPERFQNIGNENSYSISFWVKSTYSGTGASAWYSSHTFTEIRTQTSSQTHVPFSIGMRDGDIWFGRTPNHTISDQAFQSASRIDDGNWHHVVCTVNVNTLKYYIDGDLDDTKTFTAAVGDCSVGDGTVFPTQNFQIGARTQNGGAMDGFANGDELTNFQFWDTELLAADVDILYNNGQPLMTGTQPQESNLIGWYKMNQSANWEADTAGNWQIPDAVSSYPQSFDFSGGNYIDCSNDSSLSPSNFTLSVWAKSNLSNGSWISKYASENYGFGIYGGNIFLNIKTSAGWGGLSLSASSYLTANNWHHIVGTYDETDLKIYIDGNLAGTLPKAGPITYTSRNTRIGNLEGTSALNFDGQISNAQIFDTALPATGTNSVQTLYNSGVPLTTAIASDNLKAWYKLDNTEKFDGTDWSVENQKYPAGFDSALNFDGSNNEKITANNITSLNTGDLSASIWVYATNSGNNIEYLFDNSNALAQAGFTIAINSSNGHAWYIGRATTTHQYIVNNVNINFTNNVWNHLCFSYNDTTKAFVLYLNGNPVNSGTATSATKSPSTNPITIGGQHASYDFTGKLSNAAIFNTALDPAAVTALYNNGTPETSISSSPISWWKLNNLTTGIQDSAGSNDGTNNGATKVNTFVSTEAGVSSGMTEQNLVNNNVSTLNAQSQSMATTSLVQSNLTRTQPYSNYSFNFDGATNDYINSTDDDIFSFGDNVNDSPFSMSAWIKTTSTTGKGIISKWGNTGTSGYEWLFWMVTNKARLNLLDSANTVYQVAQGNTNINTGEWVHVVTTYDGRGNPGGGSGNTANQGIKIYVNGIEDTPYSYLHQGTYIAMHNTPRIVQIGSYNNVGQFDGQISNAAIFDRVLTEQEVLKIYNNGVTQDLQATSTFSNNIVAWWPMDQRSSYYDGTNWVVREIENGQDGTGVNTGNIEDMIGNAPGSQSNGVGSNFVVGYLEGNMKSSDKNAYSINMADYADGVTNPANSGRSTDTP